MSDAPRVESDADVREPYVAPRLTRYGSIHELTAALASGASDGLTGSFSICSTFPC